MRYSLHPDWNDEPSIYFRIVLTDAASARESLGEVARRIEQTIWDDLLPIENWGLLCYLNFRSESVQAAMKDRDWE